MGFPISPQQISHTRRVEWLDSHVLSPTQKLESALSKSNEFYFELWPEDDRIKRFTARPSLITLLNELTTCAVSLRQVLSDYILEKIPATAEMRADIVYNLMALAFEHFPGLKLSRGKYDNELKRMVGRTPDYVRRAFLEITGSDEQLDQPIKEYVSSNSQRKRG